MSTLSLVWVTCMIFNGIGIGYSIAKNPKGWNGNGIIMVLIVGTILAPVLTALGIGGLLGSSGKKK